MTTLKRQLSDIPEPQQKQLLYKALSTVLPTQKRVQAPQIDQWFAGNFPDPQLAKLREIKSQYLVRERLQQLTKARAKKQSLAHERSQKITEAREFFNQHKGSIDLIADVAGIKYSRGVVPETLGDAALLKIHNKLPQLRPVLPSQAARTNRSAPEQQIQQLRDWIQSQAQAGAYSLDDNMVAGLVMFQYYRTFKGLNPQNINLFIKETRKHRAIARWWAYQNDKTGLSEELAKVRSTHEVLSSLHQDYGIALRDLAQRIGQEQEVEILRKSLDNFLNKHTYSDVVVAKASEHLESLKAYQNELPQLSLPIEETQAILRNWSKGSTHNNYIAQFLINKAPPDSPAKAIRNAKKKQTAIAELRDKGLDPYQLSPLIRKHKAKLSKDIENLDQLLEWKDEYKKAFHGWLYEYTEQKIFESFTVLQKAVKHKSTFPVIFRNIKSNQAFINELRENVLQGRANADQLITEAILEVGPQGIIKRTISGWLQERVYLPALRKSMILPANRTLVKTRLRKQSNQQFIKELKETLLKDYQGEANDFLLEAVSVLTPSAPNIRMRRSILNWIKGEENLPEIGDMMLIPANRQHVRAVLQGFIAPP